MNWKSISAMVALAVGLGCGSVALAQSEALGGGRLQDECLRLLREANRHLAMIAANSQRPIMSPTVIQFDPGDGQGNRRGFKPLSCREVSPPGPYEQHCHVKAERYCRAIGHERAVHIDYDRDRHENEVSKVVALVCTSAPRLE